MFSRSASSSSIPEQNEQRNDHQSANEPGQQHRRCSLLVPLLVGRFNDIIEWKAQIVKTELESQMQRTQNFVNYERRYSCSDAAGSLFTFAQINAAGLDAQPGPDTNAEPADGNITVGRGLCRSQTDSTICSHFQQEQHNEQQQPQANSKHRIIRLKRSRTQKCFNEQLQRLKNEVICSRIDEEDALFPKPDPTPEQVQPQTLEPETKLINEENAAHKQNAQPELKNGNIAHSDLVSGSTKKITIKSSRQLKALKDNKDGCEDTKVGDGQVNQVNHVDQQQQKINEKPIEIKNDPEPVLMNGAGLDESIQQDTTPKQDSILMNGDLEHSNQDTEPETETTLPELVNGEDLNQMESVQQEEQKEETIIEPENQEIRDDNEINDEQQQHHEECNAEISEENNEQCSEESTEECPVVITEMWIEAGLCLEKSVPEPPPSMSRCNVLLERLSQSHRHQYEVKTTIVNGALGVGRGGGPGGMITNKRMNNANSSKLTNMKCGHCAQAFQFSEKYLRCVNCLTSCHTSCGSFVWRPCIRYVDAFLRPSKLITNFVYPRCKPAIPCILVKCCREIEIRCCNSTENNKNGQPRPKFELYYVQSEMLKPVKDQCKRMLVDSKNGYQSLDDLNMDFLCGIVKHFLSDLIEPLFPKQIWKEYYSVNIQKKTDDELKRSLMETFTQQMPMANVHTLCFMLIHLKHLHRCRFQTSLDMLLDIFCPILLGDLECKRKLRLMRLMFQMETDTLMSFVE